MYPSNCSVLLICSFCCYTSICLISSFDVFELCFPVLSDFIINSKDASFSCGGSNGVQQEAVGLTLAFPEKFLRWNSWSFKMAAYLPLLFSWRQMPNWSASCDAFFVKGFVWLSFVLVFFCEGRGQLSIIKHKMTVEFHPLWELNLPTAKRRWDLAFVCSVSVLAYLR